MKQHKNLIIFVAHFVSEATMARYIRLCRELSDEDYDIVWALTASEGSDVKVPSGVSMAVLRPSDFRDLQYTPIYGTLVPGSCHFIPLYIFKSQRYYRHYWFIEYDVEFTGDWSVLMDDCDTNLADYDFLSCHVARFGEDNKEWTWWHRGNNCGYPLTECVKGFNPICRYSVRALECLDRHQRKGYSAHSEVMVTSCLYNHGMRIGDIGGTGEFTPQGYRNKYYVQGVGIHNGTMRWRPPYTMEEIEALGTKNKLFHPIK